jgi:transcription regulator MmyB-like protein
VPRQLPGNPAAIYDPSWSPIIWNSMWATIFGDPNERPERERNKVWRYFTGLPTRVLRSPEEERLFEKRIISDLRSSFGQYPDDEQLGQLISDLLTASPRFCELWKAREVAPYDEEYKTIEHPELGLLQLHCDIVRHEGLRVVVFTAPAGSTSAWTSIRSVLLRPSALPPGQNDPLFERPDLSLDDYYRLRYLSRLTAARRVRARLSAAFRSRALAGCAEQGNLHAAHCALGTPPTGTPNSVPASSRSARSC